MKGVCLGSKLNKGCALVLQRARHNVIMAEKTDMTEETRPFLHFDDTLRKKCTDIFIEQEYKCKDGFWGGNSVFLVIVGCKAIFRNGALNK